MAAGLQGLVRLVAVFSKAEQPENLKFTDCNVPSPDSSSPSPQSRLHAGSRAWLHLSVTVGFRSSDKFYM